MTFKAWFAWIGSAAVLATPGASLAQTYPGAGAYPGMPGAAVQQPQVPAAITQPMALTDAKVEGFFAAMKDLEALGADANANVGADPSRPQAFAQGLQVSSEGMAILQKHGFEDVTEFQRVGFNAAMAHSVLEQGGKAAVDAKLKKADADQAKALEKLKQQVSPEQYEMMKGHIGGAMNTAKIMQDVPEGNVELMTKYSEQMADLGKD